MQGSGLSLQPGDALGVLPENDPDEVSALLARLKLQGPEMFEVSAAEGAGAAAPHVRAPCSVRTALTRFVEICGAGPSLRRSIHLPTHNARTHTPPTTHSLISTLSPPPPISHLGCPCRPFPLGMPKRSLLRGLAEHCTDSADRVALLHLASKGGKGVRSRICI